ncbi:MAG TPA: hypothetical protein VMU60_10670 [Syntrophobacteria bacterium]|nr:hypothetical protein [Syntrophobacteria bacterium]
MKRLILMLGALLLTVTVALAAGPKTYQVTGPVLSLTDDVITVQKGTEKWEIARDKDTKIPADLKVGSKVTIQYQMKAVSIESKEESKKGAAPKKQ